jgi:lipopolysaccharide export system protein LptA
MTPGKKSLGAVILLLLLAGAVPAAGEVEGTPAGETGEATGDGKPRRIELGKPGEDYYLEADRVVGNFAEGIRTVRALGHVKLVQGPTEITADELYYYDREQIALLKGRVAVLDSEKDARLEGRYLEYHRADRYVIVTEEPELFLVNRAGGDVHVTGKVMEYYLDEDRGVASGGVRINQEELYAEGDRATYYGDDNKIILEGDPIAWRGDDKAGGELMTMHLLDEEGGVEKIEIDGTARAVYHVAPEEGEEDGERGKLELAGDRIVLFYVEDQADRIVCTGNATTLYLPDPASGEEGRIDSRAQEITIYLQDEVATQITLEGDAYALYQPDPGNPHPDRGRTEMQGSHMDLFLVDGELDRFVARGHAQGSYVPPERTGTPEPEAPEPETPPEEEESEE